MEQLSKLTQLLGEENEKKIRDSITDFLIEYLRDDLNNIGVCLLDWEDIFAEIRNEIKNDIKEKVGKKYIIEVEKKIEKLMEGLN